MTVFMVYLLHSATSTVSVLVEETTKVNINRNYKSSFFSFLFNDPDILRELYYALEGVELPKDTPITINTLNTIY
jgi:hypothetical protein